jgi:hypothetical protein
MQNQPEITRQIILCAGSGNDQPRQLRRDQSQQQGQRCQMQHPETQRQQQHQQNNPLDTGADKLRKQSFLVPLRMLPWTAVPARSEHH